MAYQLSDLITEVRIKAKDSTLDSTLITYHLNDTQREVLNKRMFSFMEEVHTATLSVNDLTYTYPTDLQTILSLRINDPDNTTTYWLPQYIPHRRLFEVYPDPSAYNAALPDYYTDYGRQLYWSSKLDKAYPLYLRYLRGPVDLSAGTDVPDIPEAAREILIRGGLAGVEESRDNFDIAAVHRRKIEDLTEDLVGRYSLRSLTTLGRATTRGR